ncbi:tetratricopeptide repeat protein [Formosa sp. PL04]|uniref:tetratricopeptide repeat protein n=1 Tax=Formosa sp. PL04 TaxID=3081755 RepID=UPI002980EB8A|nr:tetratricopeptide repeat protein [Formosa sp. PL04]MDW5287789.1 hypothetical protein [Formosa sp. PL04]
MRLNVVSVLILFFCFPKAMCSQYVLAKAQGYFDTQNYDQVIAILEPTVEVPSQYNFESIELLADAYSYTEQWDAASIQYENLVDILPENANYHYKYGGALAMKALSVNKLMAIPLILDAKSEFLEASELDPNHIETRWALVKIYMELPGVLGGSTSKALQFANELESLSKVDGFLAKGYLHEKDEDFKQAESFYQKALEVGGSKTCYTSLANFYINQGEMDKAETVLRLGLAHLEDEELQQKIAEITQ